MTEHEFRVRVDDALGDLSRRLAEAGDVHGFESDFNVGALAVEFEDPPGKFVVSPNAPVRQIWISAHSRSFKLDWDEGIQAFVLAESGETLVQFMASAIAKRMGVKVTL